MDRFSQSLATITLGVHLWVHEQMLIGRESIGQVGIFEVQHPLKREGIMIVAALCGGARVLRLAHPGRFPGILPLPRVGPNLSGQKFSEHKCRSRKMITSIAT